MAIPYGLAVTVLRIYFREVCVQVYTKRHTKVATAALLVTPRHWKIPESTFSRTKKQWSIQRANSHTAVTIPGLQRLAAGVSPANIIGESGRGPNRCIRCDSTYKKIETKKLKTKLVCCPWALCKWQSRIFKMGRGKAATTTKAGWGLPLSRGGGKNL